jgi:hypothetical protein
MTNRAQPRTELLAHTRAGQLTVLNNLHGEFGRTFVVMPSLVSHVDR